MQKQYCVYIHINKQNNKKYVGITSQNPERRWKRGKGYPKEQQLVFYCALQKYPDWDNQWEHIIIASGLTVEEAKQKEKQLIKKYHTWIKDPHPAGYNMTPGGDSNIFMRGDEQEKLAASEKISKKAKQRLKNPENHPRYGAHVSEESKQKCRETWKKKMENGFVPCRKGSHISEQQKEKLRQLHLGTKLPEQTKQKISQSLKQTYQEHPEIVEKTKRVGQDNGMAKYVKCLNTGEVFSTVSEALRWCGLKDSGAISKYLKRGAKSCGKHPQTGEKLQWEWATKEEYLEWQKDKQKK